jgi:hypothetical protein
VVRLRKPLCVSCFPRKSGSRQTRTAIAFCGRKALPQLDTLADADGFSLPEAFPHVYNAVASNVGADQRVGGNGRGQDMACSYDPAVDTLEVAASTGRE